MMHHRDHFLSKTVCKSMFKIISRFTSKITRLDTATTQKQVTPCPKMETWTLVEQDSGYVPNLLPCNLRCSAFQVGRQLKRMHSIEGRNRKSSSLPHPQNPRKCIARKINLVLTVLCSVGGVKPPS